jgi:excisionase family DNA binding protein
MTIPTLEPVSLPASQEEQVHQLSALMARDGKARLVGRGGEPALELPDTVFELLLQILRGMEQGKAISIVPVMQNLTTQQAAEMLGVSRPFLVKLLDAGTLPFHMVGTHRRIYLRDLLKYKEGRDRERHLAINRIGQAAEDAGLYDKVLLPDE